MGGFANIVDGVVTMQQPEEVQEIAITMKTPDAVETALDFIQDETERETVRAALNQWFQYGEYVTLLFNPGDHTIRVKSNNE